MKSSYQRYFVTPPRSTSNSRNRNTPNNNLLNSAYLHSNVNKNQNKNQKFQKRNNFNKTQPLSTLSKSKKPSHSHIQTHNNTSSLALFSNRAGKPIIASDPNTQKECVFDFIAKVCLNERYIEMRRQILCDTKDFETYVAYSRLSRHNLNGINPTAIYNFLKDCGQEVTDLKSC